MPRSIQNILDHADELAARFENYEPEPGDERPVEELLLERAALARARSDRQIVDAITTARAKHLSWQRIGELLARQPRRRSIATATSSLPAEIGRVSAHISEDMWHPHRPALGPDDPLNQALTRAVTRPGARGLRLRRGPRRT